MRNLNSSSDEDLVNLAQKGNREAYNLLFSRYIHKIRTYIFSHVHDFAHASDLSQEVFLKIYRYLHLYKEHSLFSTWLYRIIQNTIKNHYRSMNLRTNFETEFSDTYYLSRELSPENLLLNVELNEHLDLAIATLSKELRVCYSMYILEGYSYESIAKKMDCPIGTVRSRIFRARKLIMASVDHF